MNPKEIELEKIRKQFAAIKDCIQDYSGKGELVDEFVQNISRYQKQIDTGSVKLLHLVESPSGVLIRVADLFDDINEAPTVMDRINGKYNG